jgi:hypothetical protein
MSKLHDFLTRGQRAQAAVDQILEQYRNPVAKPRKTKKPVYAWGIFRGGKPSGHAVWRTKKDALIHGKDVRRVKIAEVE